MAVAVEKLPDEPIILKRYEDENTGPDIDHVYAESTRIVAELGDDAAPLYRISDRQTAKFTFRSVVWILAKALKRAPGSLTDPRFVDVFVVAPHDALGWFAVENLHQPEYGAQKIPTFDTIKAALAYVRVCLNE